MNSSFRILILTASYGNGHLQAAHALKQSFSHEGIDQVEVIDLMKEAHPFLNQISTTLYLESSKTSQYGLDYYGWSYYITRETNSGFAWNRYFNMLGKKKLKELIAQRRPDAVITTFPFGSVPSVCSSMHIPSYTIVTDFTLHTRWIHPEITKYYVAAEELRDQLVDRGIPKQKIEVSGIPIRKQFDKETIGTMVSKERMALLLAGSYVLKNIEEMVQALLFASDFKVFIVCGQNKRLEKNLKKKFSGEPRILVLGFIENIHELMSSSSCMVTKAGGITLSEAIVLQIPFFIFKPFAGQERENALFLSKKGLTMISNSAKELALHIRQFFSEEHHLAELRARMDLFRKKSASDMIVKDMIHNIKQPVYV